MYIFVYCVMWICFLCRNKKTWTTDNQVEWPKIPFTHSNACCDCPKLWRYFVGSVYRSVCVCLFCTSFESRLFYLSSLKTRRVIMRIQMFAFHSRNKRFGKVYNATLFIPSIPMREGEKSRFSLLEKRYIPHTVYTVQWSHRIYIYIYGHVHYIFNKIVAFSIIFCWFCCCFIFFLFLSKKKYAMCVCVLCVLCTCISIFALRFVLSRL